MVQRYNNILQSFPCPKQRGQQKPETCHAIDLQITQLRYWRTQVHSKDVRSTMKITEKIGQWMAFRSMFRAGHVPDFKSAQDIIMIFDICRDLDSSVFFIKAVRNMQLRGKKEKGDFGSLDLLFQLENACACEASLDYYEKGSIPSGYAQVTANGCRVRSLEFPLDLVELPC